MKMNGSDTRFKTRLAALALFVAAERLSLIFFFLGICWIPQHCAGTAVRQGRTVSASFDMMSFTVKITSTTPCQSYGSLSKCRTTFPLKYLAKITDQEALLHRHGPAARCRSWISLLHSCTSHRLEVLVAQLRQNDARQTGSLQKPPKELTLAVSPWTFKQVVIFSQRERKKKGNQLSVGLIVSVRIPPGKTCSAAFRSH